MAGKRGRPPNPLTEEQKENFLEAIAAGGYIERSAAAAGHNVRRFHREAVKDPEFKAAFDEAKIVGAYRLLDEGQRRAVEGWDEEVKARSGRFTSTATTS